MSSMRLTVLLAVFYLSASFVGGCGCDSTADRADSGCEGADACGACQAACDDNARCTSDDACVCNAGFTGDGVTCTDIDECAQGVTQACGLGAMRCLNGLGSFACFCDEGFEGTGTTACSDVDECAAEGEGCSVDPPVACTNSVGSFSCGACPDGFSGDGITCTDIDECATNHGGCGDPRFYACDNTPGSYACSDTNECAIDNGGCDSLTLCTNNVGATPTCGECPSGYRTAWEGDGVTALRRICHPLLTALSVSTGSMLPAFAAHVSLYRAHVYLTEESVSLTASAPAGATITINGDAVVSGEAWQTPTLDLGDNTFTIVVSQSDRQQATYRVTVVRSMQEAFIKARHRNSHDYFGESVALSGDTLVVGATGEDSDAVGVDGDERSGAATFAGAAYVFVRNGHAWSQQAYLKASNTAARDCFGQSVAISGDTIVVGAYLEDSAAAGVDGDQADDTVSSAGAAYVFVRAGSTWSQQAYLKASNPGAHDNFGQSVAISGDTIVVGAYMEDSAASGINGDDSDDTASNAGAAYVFIRAGSTWSQQAYLKASHADAGDNFGRSVSVSGDSILVGAPNEQSAATGVDGDATNDEAPGAGAAYVFLRDGSTWSQQAYLKRSPPLAGAFGFSVAISQDAAVVGAPYGSDVVYVFARTNGAWSSHAALQPQAASSPVGFGHAVGIVGNRIVVGAPSDDIGGSGVNPMSNQPSLDDSGAAYVFERDGTAWSQTLLLKAHTPHAFMYFGQSVAISGETIVVGAYRESSATPIINGPQTGTGAPNSGAAYVFH